MALRYVEVGKEGLSELDTHVAAVGDLLRILDGLGQVDEGLDHGFGRTEGEVEMHEADTVHVGDVPAVLDAEEDVLDFGVLLVHVVDIDGCDERDAGRA